MGVLLGNGDGTFQAAMTFPTEGYAPYSMAIADVNHDWKADLIVSSEEWGEGIVVLLGNGNGTFQRAVKFDGGGGGVVLSLRVADVNQDGKPDIIAATSSGGGPDRYWSAARQR